MNVKCLIVDDEPLALKLIETHLSKFNFFEIIGKCNSAMDAITYLNSGDVELMFLDINLPELNGLEFLKGIKEPPEVILTTAYREYAVESYELEVLDYLLKPITFGRFSKAINRFLNKRKSNPIECKEVEKRSAFTIFKDGNGYIRLKNNDIIFIKSCKEYVDIITISKKYTIKYPIGEIESKLMDANFLRTHKSYIINCLHISSFDKNSITVKDRKTPIGISYKNRVYQILEDLKG